MHYHGCCSSVQGINIIIKQTSISIFFFVKKEAMQGSLRYLNDVSNARKKKNKFNWRVRTIFKFALIDACKIDDTVTVVCCLFIITLIW